MKQKKKGAKKKMRDEGEREAEMDDPQDLDEPHSSKDFSSLRTPAPWGRLASLLSVCFVSNSLSSLPLWKGLLGVFCVAGWIVPLFQDRSQRR